MLADKGKPDQSQGRKATGPRSLRDAFCYATKGPKTAGLPQALDKVLDGGRGIATAQCKKMRKPRHVLILLPITVAAGLIAPNGRSDTFEDLTRDVCFKVHGADAQSIKNFEEDQLFGTLRVLKAKVEQKRQIAKQREEEFTPELKKLEEIKTEISRLEFFHRYNRILRVYAAPINQNALRIAELESDYGKEDNEDKKRDLRQQIDALEADLVRLNKEAAEILPKGLGKDMAARFGKLESFETPYIGVRSLDWAAMPEVTQKMEPKIQAELSKANTALPEVERNTASAKESFIAARVDLRESMRLLGLMERVIGETEGCRADAKRAAPRRDFVANFKVSCTSPDFDYPLCGHGSMWINFDARGSATGQAGFGRVCASDTQEQQCLDIPEASVTGATGQVSSNLLKATVTYMLPSKRPRQDTGEFRFEGQVTPDGNTMPVFWRGAGRVESIENKFPLPPDKPYVIACNGHWETDSVPACLDE